MLLEDSICQDPTITCKNTIVLNSAPKIIKTHNKISCEIQNKIEKSKMNFKKIIKNNN